jgi:hypothetical protein
MRHRFLGTRTLLATIVVVPVIWSTPPIRVVEAAPLKPTVAWSPCYRELGLPFIGLIAQE